MTLPFMSRRFPPGTWRALGLLAVAALVVSYCNRTTEDEWAAHRAQTNAEIAFAMQTRTEAVRRGIGLKKVFACRCKDDCAGHRAGYLWAVDNDYGGALDCDRVAGSSFREGCLMGAEAAHWEPR